MPGKVPFQENGLQHQSIPALFGAQDLAEASAKTANRTKALITIAFARWPTSWPNVHGPDRARASIILGQKHEREIKIKGENKAAHTEEMDHASRF